MAALTKAQRHTLTTAHQHLQRAMIFLYADRVQIATAFGGGFHPIAKDIGSDLTGLPDALKAIQTLLTPTET